MRASEPMNPKELVVETKEMTSLDLMLGGQYEDLVGIETNEKIKWEGGSAIEARAGTMCQNARATFGKTLARRMIEV